ncbi:MAG: hypothetical protein ACQERC_07410 [Bacteroidota bacterium]
MKLKTLIICIAICPAFLAQHQTEELSVEVGYGFNKYSMENLNRYFIDSVASQSNPKILDKKIESGQSFSASLNYRPSRYFNVGLFASYQYGSQNSTSTFQETDNFGNFIAQHERNYELKAEAMTAGISSTLFLNALLKWEQKENKLLQNLRIGVGFNGGFGCSKVTSDMRSKSLPQASYYDFYESMDFQGQTFLDVSYYMTENNMFSSIGMKLGYQYFVTKTVRDRLNNEWIVQNEHPVNLDFSGLFIGAYIMIGK